MAHLIERQQLVGPVQHARVGHVLELHVKGVEQQAAICSTPSEGGAVHRATCSLKIGSGSREASASAGRG